MSPPPPPPTPQPISILKPSYFVVRSAQGSVVPLIPADELPFNLIGVSKSMEIEDTIGMLNLGLVPGNEQKYQVLEEAKAAESVLRSATDRLTVSSAKPRIQHPPMLLTTKSVPSRPSHQICKHWCSHGTCRWTPNCRYKHQMPLTIPGLASVGLSDWPFWFRAENPEMFASVGPRLEGFATPQEGGIVVAMTGCPADETQGKKGSVEKDGGEGKAKCGCGTTHVQEELALSSHPRRYPQPYTGRYPYPHPAPASYLTTNPYPPPLTLTYRSRPRFHPPPARVTAAQIRRIMQEMSLSGPNPTQERVKAAKESLRAGGLAPGGINGGARVAGGKGGQERKAGKGVGVSLELNREVHRDALDWAEEEEDVRRGAGVDGCADGGKGGSGGGKGNLKSKGRLVDV